MTTRSMLSIAAMLPVMLVTLTGFAQNEVSDQADVWSAIEAQWTANEKNDGKWIEPMLTDDFQAWEKSSPAPRTKSSMKMWDRLNRELSRTVAHELYPLAIVVRDDVAVAHYLFTRAVEDKEGNTEIDNGRYTDILVRTDDGWKFLAWHGGDDS